MHKSKEYKYLLLCAARVKNKKPVNLKQNNKFIIKILEPGPRL